MSEYSTVCMTFDFDAISLWMARDMKTPGPISRGEFGAHAVPRILDMLADRNITSTFFIPGHTVDTYPDICRSIADAGHEIALHGYAHEPVSTLEADAELRVGERAMESIQKVTGITPKGYRTPSFDFTDNTVGILQKLGCEYDSSLMGTDYTPYYVRRGDYCPDDEAFKFGDKTKIIELPVSWTLDDYPYLEFFRTNAYVMPGLRPVNQMFESFLSDIDYMLQTEKDGVCTLTFHPQAIGRGHRMVAFEQFLDHLENRVFSYKSCVQAARDARKILESA